MSGVPTTPRPRPPAHPDRARTGFAHRATADTQRDARPRTRQWPCPDATGAGPRWGLLHALYIGGWGLVTIDRFLTESLVLNIGQQPLSLNYIPFPHNYMLLEYYMYLLEPLKNKHPFLLLISKIGTGA